jgi:hypothetical protein
VYQRTGQRSEGIANRTTRRRPQEIEAVSIRIRFITVVPIEPRALLQIASLDRADERTRTADLLITSELVLYSKPCLKWLFCRHL